MERRGNVKSEEPLRRPKGKERKGKERWRKEKKGAVKTFGEMPGWATSLHGAYSDGRGNLYVFLLESKNKKIFS